MFLFIVSHKLQNGPGSFNHRFHGRQCNRQNLYSWVPRMANTVKADQASSTAMFRFTMPSDIGFYLARLSRGACQEILHSALDN